MQERQETPFLKLHGVKWVQDLLDKATNEEYTEIISILNGAPKQGMLDTNSNRLLKEISKKFDITFLGGGNNKNYQLTPKNGSPPFILRVELSLGNAARMEDTLNNSKDKTLQNLILPATPQNREDATINNEKRALRCVQLFEGDSLSGYLSQMRVTNNPADLLGSSLNIYSQMAGILIKMQDEKCAFPDMKDSNWLYDPNTKKLYISDTKSFYPLNSENNISNKTAPYINLAVTPVFSPPEVMEFFRQTNTTDFSCDKMYSYHMAKNIYASLVGRHPNGDYQPEKSPVYFEPKPFKEEDFQYSVFNSVEGKKLQNLLIEMTDNDPNKRPTMSDVQGRLNEISQLAYTQKKERIEKYIKEHIVKTYSINTNDHQKMLKELKNSKDYSSLQKMEQNLIKYEQKNIRYLERTYEHLHSKIQEMTEKYGLDDKDRIKMEDNLAQCKGNRKKLQNFTESFKNYHSDLETNRRTNHNIIIKQINTFKHSKILSSEESAKMTNQLNSAQNRAEQALVYSRLNTIKKIYQNKTDVPKHALNYLVMASSKPDEISHLNNQLLKNNPELQKDITKITKLMKEIDNSVKNDPAAKKAWEEGKKNVISHCIGKEDITPHDIKRMRLTLDVINTGFNIKIKGVDLNNLKSTLLKCDHLEKTWEAYGKIIDLKYESKNKSPSATALYRKNLLEMKANRATKENTPADEDTVRSYLSSKS